MPGRRNSSVNLLAKISHHRELERDRDREQLQSRRGLDPLEVYVHMALTK